MLAKTIAVVVLAALVGSCSSDFPTSALDEAAAKSDNHSEEVVLLDGCFEGVDYIPCLGEDVLIYGCYTYIADIVDTPSGNSNSNGYIYASEETLEGVDSGVVWTTEGWKAKITTHTKADGSYHAVEPIHLTYYNSQGDMMRQTIIFKGRDEEVDIKYASCKVVPAR